MIIKNFLDYRRDLTLATTYVDTNTTGPDFQRRSFRQMIEAIEDNKIDCVIVESLSRLGQNPIEVGYYIESYFPRHSIFLISVTDYIKITDGVSNPDKRNSVNSCPFVKDIKGDCILCPISAKKFDIHTYQIQDQIVLLQHEIGEVNLRIVQQKFLIESLVVHQGRK